MKGKLIVGMAILLLLSSLDNAFPEEERSIRWGGRIQLDGHSSSGDPAYQPFLADGTEFRRARLFVEGDLNGYTRFKAQYDFADEIDRSATDSAGNTVQFDDAPAFKDVYLELHELPGVGAIRFGHFKEPFSLEELTSSNHNTFMERALPNLFAPSRNTGIMLHNQHAGGRLTWAVGGFAETDDEGTARSGSTNISGRFTGLPWYRDDNRFLHLGLGLSLRMPDAGTVEFSTRPEADLGGEPISTGTISNVDDLTLLSAEAAMVFKRFSVQGEYFRTDLDDGATDPGFDGWYLYGSFWLTRRDHRSYDKSAGAFGRVQPATPFDPLKGGAGAWEVALRYSQLDLSETPNGAAPPTGSTAQVGGEIRNLTIGINWHLNDFTRFMFNYVNSELEDGSMNVTNDANLYLLRIQVDW